MDAVIRIDGATRLFGIVGDPITPAKSPAVYSQLFAERGINAVLVPLHVLPPHADDLARALAHLQNLDGLLVTAPYKNTMTALAASLGPAAACVGAVNALRRTGSGGWHGDLFDGAGFVAGARTRGIALEGRRVRLFGAGGAGSAIAYELAAAGVQSIRVSDPREDKSALLCGAIRKRFPQFDIAPARGGEDDITMVVNASTVGQGGAGGLPGPLPALHPGVAVGEVNVTPSGTDLIQRANDAGSPWLDGAHMHAGQIAALMSFFFPPSAGHNG